MSSRRTFLVRSVAALASATSSFAASGDAFAEMRWLNEPASWKRTTNRVVARSKPKTDFWRTTHTGQILDNGHFLYLPVRGNFTLQGRIAGSFNAQFDQVSLMVRLDERNWIKCGLELFNGAINSGVVATRDFSDWSTAKRRDFVVEDGAWC